MILSSEYWNFKVDKIYLPKVIEKSIKRINEFYNSFNSKKVLKFSFFKSTCEIEGKFDKLYIFNFNAVQAVILLTFNYFGYTDVTLKEIMTRTGITDEKDLVTNLAGLFNSNLLIKKDALVALNKNYKNDTLNVKPTEVMNEEKFIKKEKIEDDRSAAIEATIVRVMKIEKKLNHSDLINKVMEKMEQFRIQVLVIKINFRLLKRKSIIYLKENL
jgi:hypothetical protein